MQCACVEIPVQNASDCPYKKFVVSSKIAQCVQKIHTCTKNPRYRPLAQKLLNSYTNTYEPVTMKPTSDMMHNLPIPSTNVCAQNIVAARWPDWASTRKRRSGPSAKSERVPMQSTSPLDAVPLALATAVAWTSCGRRRGSNGPPFHSNENRTKAGLHEAPRNASERSLTLLL